MHVSAADAASKLQPQIAWRSRPIAPEMLPPGFACHACSRLMPSSIDGAMITRM
jgi:hypothetical protein